MAGHLPKGWSGKQVAVLFERESGGGLKARLIGDSTGGVTVEAAAEQSSRTFFVPWTAIRYVELLEEAAERRPTATSRPAETPEDPVP